MSIQIIRKAGAADIKADDNVFATTPLRRDAIESARSALFGNKCGLYAVCLDKTKDGLICGCKLIACIARWTGPGSVTDWSACEDKKLIRLRDSLLQ